MKHFDELKDESRAIKFLSDQLADGTLTLFLGAGTSVGFGLPNWLELVNGLRLKTGLSLITGVQSAEDLQHAADEVIYTLNDNSKLIELISELLYANVDAKDFVTVLDKKLLVAVAALLMGSKRGHVTRVVTLNYDSMLQWFLSVFGFIVRTIDKLPALEGSEDVRIYHPHGYIPHPDTGDLSSEMVILGLHSANQRLGSTHDPWFEMVRTILDTSVCLFLGMSANTLSDRVLAPLFTDCGAKVVGIRPLGIWVVCNPLTKPQQIAFDNKNVIPLVLTDFEEVPKFLLKICQAASVSIKK